MVGSCTINDFQDSNSKRVASESILKIFNFVMQSLKLFEREQPEIALKNLYFIYNQLKPKEKPKFIMGIDLNEMLVLPRIEEELNKYLRIVADNIISYSIPDLYRYFTEVIKAFRYFEPEEIPFNPNFTTRITRGVLGLFKDENTAKQQIYSAKDCVYKRFTDENIQPIIMKRLWEDFSNKINLWNSFLESIYPGEELQIPNYVLQVIRQLI